MNQEIKDKLQQAADKSTEKGYSSEHPAKWHYKDGFTNGAQTILENPSEWGLVEKRLVDAGIQLRIETIKTCEETHSQNEKYKEVLERIIVESEDNEQVDWMYVAENMVEIAKEALKQQ